MPKGRQGRQTNAEILLFYGRNALPEPPTGRDRRLDLAPDPSQVCSVASSCVPRTQKTNSLSIGSIATKRELQLAVGDYESATFSVEKGNPRLAWQCECYEFWENPKTSGS